MQTQAQRLREMVQRHQNTQTNEKATRVIAISSGKGGVGKSSFTVNLAIALGKLGKKPLIVDADFGLANIDVMLGVTPARDLTYVTREYMNVRDIICTGHYGVQFVSGGNGVYDLLNLKETEVRHIVESLLHLDDIADYILFDTGAGVNDNVLRLVRSSDELILVTTPEPTAILDAYALVKTVTREVHHPTVRLVVNKIETVAEANNTIESFSRIIRKYTGIEVDPLGHIIFDQSVVRSVKKQEPLLISFPDCPAAKNINDIANKLAQTQMEASKGGIAQFIKYFIKRRGENYGD